MFNWQILCVSILACCLSACTPSESGGEFTTRHLDTSWRNGVLRVRFDQDLSLSQEAREALINGVPLVIETQLLLRQFDSRTRVAEHRLKHEIRYLPMSDRYQLEQRGQESETYPRLRHLLAEIARQQVAVSTGVLPSGSYEVLTRSQLDWQELPPPMRLPALLNGKWKHDSGWQTWQLEIRDTP